MLVIEVSFIMYISKLIDYYYCSTSNLIILPVCLRSRRNRSRRPPFPPILALTRLVTGLIRRRSVSPDLLLPTPLATAVVDLFGAAAETLLLALGCF